MFAARQVEELLVRRPNLTDCRNEIEIFCETLAECYRRGGKALVCGNGGSCADAEHIAGELMKGFMRKRPVDTALRARIETLGGGAFAGKLQTPLRAINLSTLPALSTAFANDVDPAYVFAQLALGYTDPGDVFIGISTSGNAANVHAAAITAKAKGAGLIGLTGEDGGLMHESGIYDALVRVPQSATFLIQEEHIAVYHTVCLAVEAELFG